MIFKNNLYENENINCRYFKPMDKQIKDHSHWTIAKQSCHDKKLKRNSKIQEKLKKKLHQSRL